ncbi:hypothetical protein GUITHDRAFT_114211 [Guillardia theta CCMP2712]|uniref:Uncharacterized protein n=1 Tax=Guillardia theta (strain CCMP2712) TaxID=905079 RepID=L1ITX1_GUITC|nr:hypothetical protein GUITHDRAFT_114211 [Guillardia theta CCMP2712]EKX39716.1 hypothetical protein GUITHDRAFT_114211 [Guillardia theta CCMP2712]|eukprot:XP_005826696.1 hypothetical protein GUITHDRAFT_114211 [Guillardia theta CCMP2712]
MPKILSGETCLTELPRSGPWEHRIVFPRASLRVSRGRTEHGDAWRVGFTKEQCRTITMSQSDWESWHQRHTANSKKISSGQNWRVPFQKIVGHTYLPIGSMENSLKNFRNSTYELRSNGGAANDYLEKHTGHVPTP